MSALQSSAVRPTPVRPSTAASISEPKQRPDLHLIQAPAPARSSFHFLMFCITLIAGAVVIVLVLNAEMANSTYTRVTLQQQRSQEAIVGEQLNAELADIKTADNLAKKAKKLGMVQEVNPEVLHIDSKKIATEKAAKEKGQ